MCIDSRKKNILKAEDRVKPKEGRKDELMKQA